MAEVPHEYQARLSAVGPIVATGTMSIDFVPDQHRTVFKRC